MEQCPFSFALITIFLISLAPYSWESKQILADILKRNNQLLTDFLQNLTPNEKRAYDRLSHRSRSHRSWDLLRKEVERFKKLTKNTQTNDPIDNFDIYLAAVEGSGTSGYCDPPNPCPRSHILPGAKNCLKDYPEDNMKEFNIRWEHSNNYTNCRCDERHNKFCLNSTSVQ